MKSLIIFILKICVLIFFLFILSKQIDWDKSFEGVQTIQLNSWLSGIFVVLLANLIAALRWWLLLRIFDKGIVFAKALSIFFAQLLLAQFLSNMVGDVFRVLLAKTSKKLKATEIVCTIVFDRVLALLTAMSLLIIFESVENSNEAGFLVSATLLVAPIVWFFYPSTFLQEIDNANFFLKLPKIVRRFLIGIAQIAVSKKLVLTSTGLSVIVFSGLCLVAQIALFDLGETVHFIYLFPAVLGSLAVSMLPITIGGWGLREAAMVLLLGSAGVDQSIAFSVSVFLGLCILLGSFPGLLFLLIMRMAPQPKN